MNTISVGSSSPLYSVRGQRSALHGVEAPRSRDALEFVLSAIDERQLGPGHEFLHGARHDDLSAVARRGDPRADVYREAADVLDYQIQL